jgi:ribulose-phosphate 3-epimerase
MTTSFYEETGVKISPSLMCADQANLAAEVERLEAVGADMIHLDIMDAHFAPNLPMGLGALSDLRGRTSLPFDVHLMVEDNDWFISQLAEIGVQQIAVHAESARHLDRTLGLIREAGSEAGVALNPATPLDAMEHVLGRLDFVLLMTVNPGFAGQKLVPSAFEKIAACRDYLSAREADIPISVDGNVSFENIPGMVAAGAGILVAGTSSLYNSGGDMDENRRKTVEAVAEGRSVEQAGAS